MWSDASKNSLAPVMLFSLTLCLCLTFFNSFVICILWTRLFYNIPKYFVLFLSSLFCVFCLCVSTTTHNIWIMMILLTSQISWSISATSKVLILSFKCLLCVIGIWLFTIFNLAPECFTFFKWSCVNHFEKGKTNSIEIAFTGKEALNGKGSRRV